MLHLDFLFVFSHQIIGTDLIYFSQKLRGQSWSWLYGSWIYSYLCHQCLLPLTLWVQILLMARCTRYNIMW